MTNLNRALKSAQERKQDQALAAFIFWLLVLLLVRPLAILLAWNLGVVGAVLAMGGAIATIGWWTAVGLSLLVSLVKGMLR